MLRTGFPAKNHPLWEAEKQKQKLYLITYQNLTNKKT
jgi:hypothetical protein